MESKEVINQWDVAAQSYADNQRTSPNNLTNWQIIKDMVGDVKNKKVLDAGCGDGFFSNELKTLEGNISACDGSKELIKIAKKDFQDIDFEICDLTKKLPYKDKEFDLVISSLALMDINYLDEFFIETNRILKDDGKLVFSIVHPCFFQGEWEKDENGKKIYKKIFKYWDLNTEVLNLWGETTHYHRPITWYTKLLKKYGFVIEEIKENPDDLDNFKHTKEHQRKVPLFMCFSCLKRSSLK